MKEKYSLLIVDDHPFFRQGIKFYLNSLKEFEIIGECTNGEEALKKSEQTQTRCRSNGPRNARNGRYCNNRSYAFLFS